MSTTISSADPKLGALNPAARGPRATLGWWVAAVLAVPIVAYAAAYVILGERVYPPNLLDSFRTRPWGIYPHALFGGTALATGVLQFHRGLLIRRRQLHRRLGQLYVVSCLFVGLAGLYMSFYAAEGPSTRFGFGALAVLLLATTTTAYLRIREGRIAQHREWMIRSVALIFAAVMLRIELPLLVMYFRDFRPAYQTVAWLCWVPNLVWAEAVIRLTRHSGDELVAALRRGGPSTAVVIS